MAKISGIEQRHIEAVLQMNDGYVLDFTNATFSDFFREFSIDIDDAKYKEKGGGKAKRLISFIQLENDPLVARVLKRLVEYAHDFHKSMQSSFSDQENYSLDNIFVTIEKLESKTKVIDIEAIEPTSTEDEVSQAFESIKASIDRDSPESGLDHLHTLLVHFIRGYCDAHSIAFIKDEPLNAIFGKYAKWLEANHQLEAPMSLAIMKYSISLLEKFNSVRNDQSLAHANPLLNYNEAILIFNNITSLVRFIRFIENR